MREGLKRCCSIRTMEYKRSEGDINHSSSCRLHHHTIVGLEERGV